MTMTANTVTRIWANTDGTSGIGTSTSVQMSSVPASPKARFQLGVAPMVALSIRPSLRRTNRYVPSEAMATQDVSVPAVAHWLQEVDVPAVLLKTALSALRA